ncbi:amino acid ABC transporter substrate-binding protein [Azorhizobium oxalatiphilum]|uniref:Amino acid ABC transporter substrate-binding protein n=1 Tax=Azorhizobium oxalatiphilum TaxID=980631 RepID=A0A917C306_9HYPH|nr:ABC transporter substrate-binding protein [Azorhizobium oxalatiphilum]GGF69749.1 amino acid ABC transporter substrate-binding protein [Azorhizobium oxalatiphilum]
MFSMWHRGGLQACAAAMALSAVTPALAQEPVKIGVVLPLSGPNAQFGVNSRAGIEIATTLFNATGGIKSLGGAKIELVFADVPSPNTAAAATQRLISQDKVSGVLGAFVSSITLAASEVTERAGVPMITHSFADQITARGYKYIFQVSAKATTYGEAQFDYAVALAKKANTPVNKVAIFYEDTAYGTAQAKGLRDAAKRAGIPVVIDEAYPLGVTDVAPLINKLRTSGADIVFPVSYFNDALQIIRAMRQQKLEIPTVGGAAGYIIPDFFKGLGEYSEGVFSIAPANYDFIPRLAESYKNQYGSFMTHEVIMYAAALEHMAKAIDTAKSRDPEKIRDAIAALKICGTGFAAGIPGGCTAFDGNGLSSTAYPIFVQWRGDNLVTVYPDKDAKGSAIWSGKPLN